jgi:parvulin-like peptidyl-prolyl isomerase
MRRGGSRRGPAWRSQNLLAAWAFAVCGCGAGGSGHPGSGAGPAFGAGRDIVSTVNGVGIGAQELQALAAAGKLAPRAALARLQAERLLEAEAAQRGYGVDDETRRVVRQALVQQLLRSEVEEGDIDEEELARAYAAAGRRFQTPELRKAAHVLAVVSKDASAAQQQAAHAFAVEACRQLQLSADPAATLQTFKAQDSEQLHIKVEELPAVANDGSFVAEFMQALFTAKAAGVIAEPVHTSFGWHAIVVTEIRPAASVPLSAARPQLQRELAVRRNKERLVVLLQRLQAHTAVQYSQTIRQAFTQLDL